MSSLLILNHQLKIIIQVFFTYNCKRKDYWIKIGKHWPNQIRDMEKSHQKISRALPFFLAQLPHNFSKKKLQTGTSESISGTCFDV